MQGLLFAVHSPQSLKPKNPHILKKKSSLAANQTTTGCATLVLIHIYIVFVFIKIVNFVFVLITIVNFVFVLLNIVFVLINIVFIGTSLIFLAPP